MSYAASPALEAISRFGGSAWQALIVHCNETCKAKCCRLVCESHQLLNCIRKTVGREAALVMPLPLKGCAMDDQAQHQTGLVPLNYWCLDGALGGRESSWLCGKLSC